MDQAPPASELAGSSALAQNTVVTASSGSGGNVPTGAMTLYISATPPSGWLICDGTAVSRTTFATLFTVLGSTYGAGDGSTTFNLPDLRGRVPVGQGTHADVSSLNANDGQTVANRRPKHRTTNGLGGSSFSGTTTGQSLDHTHAIPNSISAGGGTTAEQWVNNSPGVQYTASTAGASNDHTHSFSGTTGSPSGSVGTGNANDALDAPSYIVVSYIIKT